MHGVHIGYAWSVSDIRRSSEFFTLFEEFQVEMFVSTDDDIVTTDDEILERSLANHNCCLQKQMKIEQVERLF